MVASWGTFVSGDHPAPPISDRYRILRELGRGGMGVVYLAYDTERDMEVAIKLCTYPQMSPLHIKREFRVAASLRHRNLVEFYELIYHKHLAYFTMEYVDGCSLRKYVSADPRDHQEADGPGRTERGNTSSVASTKTLPPILADGAHGPHGPHAGDSAPAAPPLVDFDRVRDVLGQLAFGLACLHAGGVVHRDVKPSNVLVTRDGAVKLLDFGLARATEALEPIDGDGHLVGTAAYLAPEYIEHLQVSPALDLYALGVVGYELCTGSPPFGGTLYSIARQQQRVAIPNARLRNPATPPDLDALLTRLLSATPEGRPTAAEVANLLAGTDLVEPVAMPPKVIGRAREIARLRDLLEHAAMPQLVLITGAAGLGKSTLMAYAIASLPPERHLVWRGYCHERERVPYRAFDAIVDDLADALEDGERKLDDLPFAAALSRVFPALAEPLAPFVVDATPPALDLHIERERALVGMAELIARQADVGAPTDSDSYHTVIAIENLQWADAESVELIAMLLQLDRPVSIVATCTTEQGTDELGRPLLPDVIAELAYRNAAVERLDLEPLAEADLCAIAQDAAPGLPAAEYQDIAREAAGNPYLADVLARDAADRFGRPSRGVAPRQLSRLPPGQRLVAAAVAASASGASFDQLRFVTQLASLEVLSTLRALEAERVLRATPSLRGEASYGYSHELLRRAGYAALEEPERRRLHARFATWLEHAGGTRPALPAIAEHWHLAGDFANAARWALAAADASLGRLAFGAAAAWYERALELSAQAPAEAAEALASVRRRARIGHAEATYLDGDIRTAARCFLELVDSDPLNAEHWRKRVRDAGGTLEPERPTAIVDGSAADRGPARDADLAGRDG